MLKSEDELKYFNPVYILFVPFLFGFLRNRYHAVKRVRRREQKANSEVKWSESHSVMSDSLRPHGLYSPWNSPGQNTGVGSLSLFQGIFPTQVLNPGLPHCRQILYQLSYKASPRILEWIAYPFSSGSSQSRGLTGVSCTGGGFFANWAMREAQRQNKPYII